MQVAILNIGDELLIGQVVNTNASRMSQMLTAAGIDVAKVVVCSDNADDIAASLKLLTNMADAVLVTGGLGPTKDDVTKQVLCQLYGSELYENEMALDNVRRIFAVRGYELTEVNRRQAWVPRCCTVINNVKGTAPCMWFERDGRVVVAMPGVPFEMEHLMQTEVVARLKQHFHVGHIVTKNILVQGIGESFLSDLIEPWELSLPSNISLAYLPVAGMVKLRITAHGVADDGQAERQVQSLLPDLYSLAGQYIVGEDAEMLPQLVARAFACRRLTLSVAESCTGGSIAAGLTALAGASDYFLGGIVSYSNAVKHDVLGVDDAVLASYGAVSEPVVRQMAEGVRHRTKSDYSVATSGIAGPSGGSPDKPVGTVWMALSTPQATYSKCMRYSGDRRQIIDRACNEVYAWLVRTLIAEQGSPADFA